MPSGVLKRQLVIFIWCIVAGLVHATFADNSRGKNDPEPGAEAQGSPIKYRAGAVEYDCPTYGTPETGDLTPTAFMLQNVDNYKAMSLLAAEQGVDILVFPEYGLTSLALPADRKEARPFFQIVPEVEPGSGGKRLSVPCEEFSPDDPDQVVVYQLSCMAREVNMYVVVDLAEVAPCDNKSDSNCPSDGHYFYNTAVAFDRNGTVIAKYRKVHLYLEPQMNYPPNTAISFTTDFGVEFGLFVCFDIMFQHPLIDLHSRGIRDLIFPTAWVDGYPMFLAHQVQSFTAIGLESNLIAAGYHNPTSGSMGSGIYSTTANSTVYAYSAQKVNRLVVSDVISPPSATGQEGEQQLEQAIIPPLDIDVLEEPHNFIFDDFQEYNMTFLEAGRDEVSVCDGDGQRTVCCHLTYSTSIPGYALGAFSGRILIQNQYSFVAQACTLVYCSSTSDPSSCGRPPSKKPLGFGFNSKIMQTIAKYFPFLETFGTHLQQFLGENFRKAPKFENFNLTAEFPTRYVYPSGFDESFTLRVPGDVEYRAEEKVDIDGSVTKWASLGVTEEVENLMYVGLYARLFADD